MAEVFGGEKKVSIEYFVSFEGHNEFGGRGGYSFPCDEHGNIDWSKESADARKNYEWAKAHSKKWDICNGGVVRRKHLYREPRYLICECGEKVYLDGQGYYGAFECPNCGEWYNAFGQELNPPSEWEEPLDEEDYY